MAAIIFSPTVTSQPTSAGGQQQKQQHPTANTATCNNTKRS